MKNILQTVLIFCMVIVIPYVLIACMSGFTFDMRVWVDFQWICYVILTIILGGTEAQTIHQNDLNS